MVRCGCDGTCTCRLVEGDNVTITGNGSQNTPYVISSSGGGSGTQGPQGAQGFQGGAGAQGSQGFQGSSGGGGGAVAPPMAMRAILRTKNGVFQNNQSYEERMDMWPPSVDPFFARVSLFVTGTIAMGAGAFVDPRISYFGAFPAGVTNFHCVVYTLYVIKSDNSQRLFVTETGSLNTIISSAGETLLNLPQLLNTISDSSPTIPGSTGSDLSVHSTTDHGANTGVQTAAGGLFHVSLTLQGDLQ